MKEMWNYLLCFFCKVLLGLGVWFILILGYQNFSNQAGFAEIIMAILSAIIANYLFDKASVGISRPGETKTKNTKETK